MSAKPPGLAIESLKMLVLIFPKAYGEMNGGGGENQSVMLVGAGRGRWAGAGCVTGGTAKVGTRCGGGGGFSAGDKA